MSSAKRTFETITDSNSEGGRDPAPSQPEAMNSPEPPPNSQGSTDQLRQQLIAWGFRQARQFVAANEVPSLKRGCHLGFFSLAAKELWKDDAAGLRCKKWFCDNFVSLMDQVSYEGTADWLGIIIAAVLSFDGRGKDDHLARAINFVTHTCPGLTIDVKNLDGIQSSPLEPMRQSLPDQVLKIEKTWQTCRYLWNQQKSLFSQVAVNAVTHGQIRIEECDDFREEVHSAPWKQKSIREIVPSFQRLNMHQDYWIGFQSVTRYLDNDRKPLLNGDRANWCINKKLRAEREVQCTNFEDFIKTSRARQKALQGTGSQDAELVNQLIGSLEVCARQRDSAVDNVSFASRGIYLDFTDEMQAKDVLQRFKYVVDRNFKQLEGVHYLMRQAILDLK